MKDLDKSQEVFARFTLSTSTMKSTEEQDALKAPLLLELLGNKSVENSCGSLSVMDPFFGV